MRALLLELVRPVVDQCAEDLVELLVARIEADLGRAGEALGVALSTFASELAGEGEPDQDLGGEADDAPAKQTPPSTRVASPSPRGAVGRSAAPPRPDGPAPARHENGRKKKTCSKCGAPGKQAPTCGKTPDHPGLSSSSTPASKPAAPIARSVVSASSPPLSASRACRRRGAEAVGRRARRHQGAHRRARRASPPARGAERAPLARAPWSPRPRPRPRGRGRRRPRSPPARSRDAAEGELRPLTSEPCGELCGQQQRTGNRHRRRRARAARHDVRQDDRRAQAPDRRGDGCRHEGRRALRQDPRLRRQAFAVQGRGRGPRHHLRARADLQDQPHRPRRRGSPRVRDRLHAAPHRDRRRGRRGRRLLLDDGEQVPLPPRRARVPPLQEVDDHQGQGRVRGRLALLREARRLRREVGGRREGDRGSGDRPRRESRPRRHVQHRAQDGQEARAGRLHADRRRRLGPLDAGPRGPATERPAHVAGEARAREDLALQEAREGLAADRGAGAHGRRARGPGRADLEVRHRDRREVAIRPLQGAHGAARRRRARAAHPHREAAARADPRRRGSGARRREGLVTHPRRTHGPSGTPGGRLPASACGPNHNAPERTKENHVTTDSAAAKKTIDDHDDETPSRPAPAKARYERIALGKIEPDPDQPRKTFDPTALAELAASVEANDVIVPVKVRPHPKKAGSFLLVAGERRWRAAGIAGLVDLPAVVEDLDARRAFDQQIIENSHREGIPPLEEADAYVLLMKKHKYSEEQLIQRTGRSKAYLWGRMKLLELVPYAMKALKAGSLPVAHAELVARIDGRLQEQLAKEVLGLGLNHKIRDELDDAGVQHESLAEEDGKNAYSGDNQILSYRATKLLIRRRYMTKLALAKFNPHDAKLTNAGACTSCPHRSGNQPELPGVTAGKGDDLCTRPPCFEEKTKATWKLTAAAAKERGLEVLSGKDAERVFSPDGTSIAGDSPYVALDTLLPYELDKKPGSKATYGKLLGKAELDIKRVLVQDETGAPRELLVKASAVKKLRELGKVDRPATPSSTGPTAAERQAQEAREKKKNALHEATIRRVLEQVATAAAKDPGGKELAMWRWLGRACVGEYGGNEAVEERRGIESKRGGFGALFDKAKNVGEVRSLLMEHLLAEAADRGTGSYPSKHHKDVFEDGCKIFGVDWDKAAAAAKAAYEAEQKSDAAKDAKKAAPKKGKAK